MNVEVIKKAIEEAIKKKFGDGLLSDNAINLFKRLNYNTERSLSLPDQSYISFKVTFVNGTSIFNENKALVSQ